LAGVVLLLLLLDPTRDLALVAAFLAAAIILEWVAARLLGPRK